MAGILADFRFILDFFKPYYSKHRMYIVLCGCQNISVDQQKRNDAGQTASVTIQELHAYDTFMDGNLLITCMGLYGSEKDRSTDRRNVTISMKVTNTTDFDTNITATQFAVTFNGYLVNYVSKLDYVNEVTNNPATTTSFIIFLPLDANIPPHSSLLGGISFDVKASDYTRERFESIKVFYRGYDEQTKAIWTVTPEDIDWEAVEKMDKGGED